jgi:hypothetical protein
MSFFSADFFPTPDHVIDQMLKGVNLKNKKVLEPSAGNGNIVTYLQREGAEVIACENNQDLKKILQTKCTVIAEDFLTVESHQISHVDLIVMNPPFSADEAHILHAYNIAPAGCKIISLCNLNTVKHTYTEKRKELKNIIDNYGSFADLGPCFNEAERKTGAAIGLIKLQKPGSNYNTEFDGFFMDEDPEEQQYNGLMPYNFVRDLVNRYVAAVKIFDEQLITAVRLNDLTSSFYGSKLAMSITERDAPKTRNEFKKDLQKNAWNFIFNKMNMQKYATRGLKEDINKFVENQHNVPFTMRNIYKMLEIVIGTTESRMDRAILEVFEKLTKHHAENRYNVEGWKTNSHYTVNKRFIVPNIFGVGWSGQLEVTHYAETYEVIDDLHKALCFLTGENYDKIGSFWSFNHIETEESKTASSYKKEYIKHEFNKWYEFGMFKVKGFKKGTGHFEFKDENIWGKFNQRISKLKGYPLFEPKAQTKYQERQTGRAQQEKGTTRKAQEAVKMKQPNILFTFKVA